MLLRRTLVSGFFLAATALSGTAGAFPGFYAYKGKKPANLSTHVILMKRDATTVVTVMPDYEGDLKPFVVVMPVPDDVKATDARSLKREFVERIDEISAPRFHEFWEMDPCEPGEAQQEWQRDLSVKSGAGFLGMDFGGDQSGEDQPKFKPSKEMHLAVDPEFKEGEEAFSLIPASAAANIEGVLKAKGYTSPEGTNQAVAPYVKAGMQFLVTEVDTKKMELVGSDRAIVSPIRYSTNKPVDVDSTLGLLNLEDGGKQEEFIYVIHPDQRFEVKNYPNVFPPTNVEVDFKVKERIGEFYAGLHDLLLKKQPLGVLNEFAWPTKGCGQPCATEPLLINELLTLGADVFEQALPKAVREPKAPDMTDDEKKAFADIKDKKKKKEIEEMRKEGERRKQLIARHFYVLTRLHHRYDKTTLTKDFEIGPASPIHGGVDIPTGPQGTLPMDVKPAADNQFQVRFTSFHQSPAIAHCDKPERWRWGKAPRTYLGLRKIWLAQDTATKNRTSYKPADLVYTPIPDLGLAGKPELQGGIAEVRSFGPAPSASASADAGAGTAGGKAKGTCGCEIPGRRASDSRPLFGALAALGLTRLRRRRTS
jgi:hypothetical protein